MMRRWLTFIAVAVASAALAIPAYATESRIVDGDGCMTDDTELVQSIWRLGLCDILPGDEYGFEIAQMAVETLPPSFAASQRFRTIRIEDVDPSTLTASDIIAIGREYSVDALVSGNIIQSKSRGSAWSLLVGGDMYEVRVSIAFDLYDCTNGELVWERTLKKDRTVGAGQVAEIMRRFSVNIANDMVPVLIEDGFTGRDVSLNEPPEIACPRRSLIFSTSAMRLTGTVTDDFGIDEVHLSCVGGEIIAREERDERAGMAVDVATGETYPIGLFTWAVHDTREYELDTVIKRCEVAGDELVIVATDCQGREAHYTIVVQDALQPITGQIANISGDTIFLNIGTNSGVEEGMIFTVQSDVSITDPTTGAILGSSTLEVGMLEVTSVEPDFATCQVIEGKLEDMHPGDTVY